MYYNAVRSKVSLIGLLSVTLTKELRRYGQVVRQRIANSFIPSSNPGIVFQKIEDLDINAVIDRFLFLQITYIKYRKLDKYYVISFYLSISVKNIKNLFL